MPYAHKRVSAHSRTGLLSLIPAVVMLGGVGCAHNTTQPNTAQADATSGYVTSGGQVVRAGTGGCVRTGFWQEKQAIKECDPQLVAEAPAPAAQPPEEVAASAPAETAPAPETDTAEASQTPEPVQEETVAQPTPEPERIYLGADAYFGFNQADLTAQAKRALDTIAQRANDASDEANIRVVGHADQLGSEDYNLTLSQRRADAVRTYLIEQGVPEGVVEVEARGASDPIVSCEGRQGKTLIQCLQPNRRTEIEFSALEAVDR